MVLKYDVNLLNILGEVEGKPNTSARILVFPMVDEKVSLVGRAPD